MTTAGFVRIDGQYYHVDLFAGLEQGFLKSDTDFWGSHSLGQSTNTRNAEAAFLNGEEEAPRSPKRKIRYRKKQSLKKRKNSPEQGGNPRCV